MEGIAGRKWLAVALVAVVLPTSFLMMFKAEGIVPERRVMETVIADTVMWNTTRPASWQEIRKYVKSSWESVGVFVEWGVSLEGYEEDDYSDKIEAIINATAVTGKGFIYSLVIDFNETDSSSSVYASEPLRLYRRPANLVLTVVDGQATAVKEGHIAGLSVNYAYYCALKLNCDWLFYDTNNQNHEFRAVLSVTYFDGAVYKKVVLPIQIGVHM